jgi:hypothetical protein
MEIDLALCRAFCAKVPLYIEPDAMRLVFPICPAIDLLNSPPAAVKERKNKRDQEYKEHRIAFFT